MRRAVNLIPTFLLMISAPLGAADLINGLGGTAGFGENVLAIGDDNSQLIDLRSVFPTGLTFYGRTFTDVYLNNNGNLTIGTSSGTFTPTAITGNFSRPIIAAWYADVETSRVPSSSATPGGTSTGANRVWYDFDAVAKRVTFTWDDVSYYGASVSTNKTNAFQIILTGLGDGDFTIEYRYEALQWTTGGASGGTNGLGGTIARAGYSAGDGAHFFELTQSGNQAAMLGLTTATNCDVPGVQRFRVQRPVASLTTSAPWVSADIVPVGISFPVSVTGLALEDFAITGGDLGTLSGSGTSYQLTVRPASDGPVQVSLAANAVQTEFLTGNPAAVISVIVDRVPPTVAAPARAIGGATQTLTGTAIDGLSGLSSTEWRVVSGDPAQVLFASPGALTSALSLSADGLWTIALQATDRAGNVASAPVEVIRDTTPPVVVAGSDRLVSGSIELQASASDALTDISLIAWTQVSGPGTANFSSPVALAGRVVFPVDGTYVLQVQATDGAGNVGTSQQSVTSDTTPPAAPVVDSLPVRLPLSFTLAGQAEPLSTVEITIDGVLAATAQAAADGRWSIAVTTTDGDRVLRARARDAAGNTGLAQEVSVTVDGIAPRLVLVDPIRPVIGLGPIVLRLRPSEPVIGWSTTAVSVGNATVTATTLDGGDVLLTVVPQQPGAVTVRSVPAAFTDTAGNAAADIPLTLVALSAGPALVIDQLVLSGSVSGATGTRITVGNATVALDPAAGTWQATVPIPATAEPLVVSPVAVDPDGRTSGTNRTFAVTRPGNG